MTALLMMMKRFLNVLIVSDSITEAGSLFHATRARSLKEHG